MSRKLIVILICCVIVLTTNICMASDQERSTQTIQNQEQQVYGWELMTPEERIEHRKKMRSFQSELERETYRLEHHKEMEERARARGVTLPDMPPQSQGQGMGPGGKGMGSGGRGR